MASFPSVTPLVCNSCDSEYKISFSRHDVDGEPDFCPFCGESIDYYGMDEIVESDDEGYIEEIFEEE